MSEVLGEKRNAVVCANCGTVRVLNDERVVKKWDLWLMRTVVYLTLFAGVLRVITWVLS